MKKKIRKLDALSIKKSAEGAHEFEYKIGGKVPSGLFISIKSSASEYVMTEQAALRAAEKAREQAAEASGSEYKFDAEGFGAKMAALRINGWRGDYDAYTPENAEYLCSINSEIALDVIEESKKLENFMKL